MAMANQSFGTLLGCSDLGVLFLYSYAHLDSFHSYQKENHGLVEEGLQLPYTLGCVTHIPDTGN